MPDRARNIAYRLLGIPVVGGVAAGLLYMATNQNFLRSILRAIGNKNLSDPTLVNAVGFQNSAEAGLLMIAGIAIGAMLSTAYILNDMRKK